MKSFIIRFLLVVCIVLLAFAGGYFLRGERDAVRSAYVGGGLAKILLGLSNYHDVHGVFPAPSGTGHTWRLSLFEDYLDGGYEGYDRTIPWNAPANLKWSKKIGGCPPVYSPHPDNPDVSRMFICTDLKEWRWRGGARARVYPVGDEFIFVVFDPRATSHWLDPDLPPWPL
jgi:hypothetical protein